MKNIIFLIFLIPVIAFGQTDVITIGCGTPASGTNGTDGVDGISCWDLNGDGINDANEDANNDGVFDALDCQGISGVAGSNGIDGLNCWDLNNNGINDAPEDVNNDGVFNTLDCQNTGGGGIDTNTQNTVSNSDGSVNIATTTNANGTTNYELSSTDNDTQLTDAEVCAAVVDNCNASMTNLVTNAVTGGTRVTGVFVDNAGSSTNIDFTIPSSGGTGGGCNTDCSTTNECYTMQITATGILLNGTDCADITIPFSDIWTGIQNQSNFSTVINNVVNHPPDLVDDDIANCVDVIACLPDNLDNDPLNEIELPTGGNNGDVLSTDGNGNYTWVIDQTSGGSGVDGVVTSNTVTGTTTKTLTTTRSNGLPTLTTTWIDLDTQLTGEEVQDFVGSLFTGNTENGITSVYNDVTNQMELTVTGGSTNCVTLQADNNFLTADNSDPSCTDGSVAWTSVLNYLSNLSAWSTEVNNVVTSTDDQQQSVGIGGANSSELILEDGGSPIVLQGGVGIGISETGNTITVNNTAGDLTIEDEGTGTTYDGSMTSGSSQIIPLATNSLIAKNGLHVINNEKAVGLGGQLDRKTIIDMDGNDFVIAHEKPTGTTAANRRAKISMRFPSINPEIVLQTYSNNTFSGRNTQSRQYMTSLISSLSTYYNDATMTNYFGGGISNSILGMSTSVSASAYVNPTDPVTRGADFAGIKVQPSLINTNEMNLFVATRRSSFDGTTTQNFTADNSIIGQALYAVAIDNEGYVEMEFVNPTSIKMTPTASASVPNESFFVDSGDGKMKYKDSTGTVNDLY